jgi:hypothetical protein
MSRNIMGNIGNVDVSIADIGIGEEGTNTHLCPPASKPFAPMNRAAKVTSCVALGLTLTGGAALAAGPGTSSFTGSATRHITSAAESITAAIGSLIAPIAAPWPAQIDLVLSLFK